MSIAGRVTPVSCMVATVATMAVSRFVVVLMLVIVIHVNPLWIVVHVMADLHVLRVVRDIVTDLHLLWIVLN